MARNLTIGVLIFGKDKLSGPARAARVGVDALGDATVRQQRAARRAAKTTKSNFVPALRGLAFAAAAAGAALGKMAIKAGDYDRQIRLAAFLTKNTNEKFAEFNEGVKEISSDLAIMPTDIARAGQAIGRLGFRGEASLLILREAATLTAASLGELSGEGAAGAVGTALRAFGRDAEDAKVVADSMTNAVSNTALNFKKLPLALGTAAGFAAGFGADLNELLGVLGAVNDVIPRTERAATGVRNIFRDLSDVTAQAKLKQAGFNLEVVDAAGEFRGIVPILEELFEQTEKMTGAQKLQAFQTGFSVEAATTLAALQERLKSGFEGTNGQVVKGIEGFKLLIESMGVTGSASALAEEKLKGFAGAMDKFKTEGTLLAQSIGDAMSTVLVPALNLVTRVMTSLRKAFDSLGPTGRTLIGILGIIGIIAGFVGAGIVALGLVMGSWTIIAGGAAVAVGALATVLGFLFLELLPILVIVTLIAAAMVALANAFGADIDTPDFLGGNKGIIGELLGSDQGDDGTTAKGSSAADTTLKTATGGIAASSISEEFTLDEEDTPTPDSSGAGASPRGFPGGALPPSAAPSTVVLNLDGREVARALAEFQEDENDRNFRVST